MTYSRVFWGSLLTIGVVVGLLISGTLGTFFFVNQTGANPTETADPMNEVKLEYLIHQEVNEQREAHGLSTLEFDTRLRGVSREYSQTMAKEDFFSHYHPESNQSFEQRYERTGYHCTVSLNETHVLSGGENLALTHYDKPVNTTQGERATYKSMEALAEAVVGGWMNSPDHRDNLLLSNWAVEGIGMYVTENQTVYVTQNFC